MSKAHLLPHCSKSCNEISGSNNHLSCHRITEQGWNHRKGLEGTLKITRFQRHPLRQGLTPGLSRLDSLWENSPCSAPSCNPPATGVIGSTPGGLHPNQPAWRGTLSKSHLKHWSPRSCLPPSGLWMRVAGGRAAASIARRAAERLRLVHPSIPRVRGQPGRSREHRPRACSHLGITVGRGAGA